MEKRFFKFCTILFLLGTFCMSFASEKGPIDKYLDQVNEDNIDALLDKYLGTGDECSGKKKLLKKKKKKKAGATKKKELRRRKKEEKKMSAVIESV